MTRDQAMTIVRLLGDIYRRDDWSAERQTVWTALLEDLPFDLAQEAVLGWARNEKWPPAPAEIRALTFDLVTQRAERERITASQERKQLPSGELEPAAPMTVTQLHLWRAAVGRPLYDCGCESCLLGKAIASKRSSEAAKVKPGALSPEEQAEVERVRAWAQSEEGT